MSDLEYVAHKRLRRRADAAAASRRRNRAALAENPDIPHGTVSTYNNHMCRCTPCREAKSASAKRRRQARLDGPDGG